MQDNKTEEITEVSNQIQKKAHRERKDLQKMFNPQFDDGDNTKIIGHDLELFSLPSVDMNNADEVRTRFEDYLKICVKNDAKCSWTGFALALGIDRRRLWEYTNGVKSKPKEVVDTLKKAHSFLDNYMNDLMQNGKINPVSGIFLMKNNFGYADKQEIIVQKEDKLGTEQDENSLNNKYLDSIVDEKI